MSAGRTPATPNHVRRWLALSSADRTLLLTTVFLVAAVRIALSTLPWRAVRHLVSRRARPARSNCPVSTERLRWAVARASAVVPGASCLTQALTLQVVLARKGLASELRFGAVVAGAFDAHAWLECDGSVLIGEGARRRYAALKRRGHARR